MIKKMIIDLNVLLFIFGLYFIIQPITLNNPDYFNIKNLIIPSILVIFYLVYKYLINCLSCFLLFFFYFLLYSVIVKINFGGGNLFEFFIVILFDYFLISLLMLIKQSKIHQKIKLIILFFIYLIFILPLLFYLFYNYNDGVAVTTNILNAIFQTNVKESKEFLATYIGIDTYILFFIVLIIVFFILKVFIKSNIQIKNKFLIFNLLILFLIVSLNIKNLQPINFIMNSYKEYQKQVETFKNINFGKEKNNKFEKYDFNKSETIVIVIGESLNRNHMSLYGYKRNTTPLLKQLDKKGEILVFKNAYTNFVATEPSLSYALTNINQINEENITKIIDLISFLKEKGFKTYWITNQNIGNDLVSAIAKKANVLINLNKNSNVSYGGSFDQNIFIPYKKILKQKITKKVIFVHLMGSHANYCLRYPIHSKFNHFKGNVNSQVFPKLSKLNNKIESIDEFFSKIKTIHNLRSFKDFIKQLLGNSIKNFNCYDNSVLYNDYIIFNLIEYLKKLDPNKMKMLVYFSDHSEDIDHQLAHNPELYTPDMAEIPLIMWFSDEYKSTHIYKNLKNNEKKLFCNDSIYNTILGVLGYENCNKHEYHNLTCKNYFLPNDKAYILHSKKLYKSRKKYEQ